MTLILGHLSQRKTTVISGWEQTVEWGTKLCAMTY